MIKSLHSKITLLFSLVFVLTSITVNAQKSVLNENFDTSSGGTFTKTGTIAGSIWTVTNNSSASNFGAKIDNGLLSLTNTVAQGTNNNGWVKVSTLNSEFGNDYKPTLNQCKQS